MKLLSSFFFLLLLTTITHAQSSEKNPIEWSTKFKELGKNKLEIVFYAKIKPKWKVYSQFLESDNGPIATNIHFEETENPIEIFSNKETTSKSINKIEGKDNFFKMNLIKFRNDFKITLRVQLNDSPIKGYLEYMCCDDKRCMHPQQVSFEYQRKS